MLIRILDAFFNRRLDFFRELNFTEIKITFQSRKSVSISKKLTKQVEEDVHRNDERESKVSVSIRATGFGDDDKIHTLKASASPRTLAYIDLNLPVDRVGQSDSWVDFETGSVVCTNEILEKYGHMLPENVSIHSKIPSWLAQAIGAVDTHLIETQRLLSLETEDALRIHSRVRRTSTSVVETDAEDLAERIGRILTKYANDAQKLDESFPKRIIDVFPNNSHADDAEKPDDEQQIRDRLEKLRQKRDDLFKVGLIGETISEPIQPSEIFQHELLRKFLSVYIEDTEKKLGIFDDIYEKIKLFKQIIDEHFTFKRIDFSNRSGILVRDQDTEKGIPLSKLSSGEQHELVLIYSLLFKVERGSLILIDEPELSLHVAWQKKFISDIQKIQSLKNLTFVIATHSPQIINDKWNLVQDLASQDS